MASNIKFKRSAVQNRVPTTAQLELGELALNTYDGKLYTEINTGSAAVVEIGSKLSSLVVDGDNGAGNGDVTFHGATANRDLLWDASADSLIAKDNTKIIVGDGTDLSIYSDGTNGLILSDTLRLKNKSGGDVYLKADSGAAVELYHNDVKRFETTADGADISGTGSLKIPVGTTAQRSASPTAGDLRYNTTTGGFEGYSTDWGEIGAGGVGIGSVKVNPGSGVISNRIGVGFTDINFVGAGLSVTGYGSTVVVDISDAVSRRYGRNVYTYTATEGQTTFTGLSYTNATIQISVYLNGARLSASSYTATSGNTVVLDTGASVGDNVEILELFSGVDLSRTLHSFTATAGQTTFTGLSYLKKKDLDVYLNGVRLAQSDYTAIDGGSIVLSTGASVNDLIEVVDMGAGATWTVGNTEPEDIYRLDGGVGIGTTNPTDKLNVIGNARIVGILTVGTGSVTIDNTTVKTGSTNVHNVGVELAGINVLGADTPIGVGVTIYNSGGALFAGTSGIVTATAFHGDGSQLTGIDATKIITGNTQVQTIDTGSDGHVKVLTEGSERLRITSGGDLGVGNASPNCRLSVKDVAEHTAYANVTPSVGDCMLQLYNNPPNETANDHATMQFGVNGGSHNRVNSISAVAESAGNRKLALTFCTDSGSNRNERMRISGDGNVGIGITNPYYDVDIKNGTSARVAIDVSTGSDASIIMDGINADFAGSDYYSIKAQSTGEFAIFKASSEKFRIDSSGNIGIGIADPDAYQSSSRNLVIGKASDAAGMTIRTGTSNGGYIRFADGTSGNQAYRGTIAYVHDGDYMMFATDSTEKLRITSGGNVGIGTDLSGASGKFQVFGTNTVLARFGNTIGDTYEAISIKNTVAGYPAVCNDSSSDTLDLRSMGSVQVTVDSNNNSTGKYFRVVNNGEGNSATELFRVGDNGNIGINESNPQDLLHIGGTSTDLRFTANQIKFDRDSAASYIDQYGTGSIVFRTTPSGSQLERLTITSSGTVNIGTNNLSQTTFKSQIETGTNKFISFGSAAHDDLSNEGSGIIFSRVSDGAKSLSAIFGHSNTSLGLAARSDLTFHAGGTSVYSAAPERLRITSGGQILSGLTTPYSTVLSNQTPKIQLESTSVNGSSMFLLRDGADAGGPFLFLGHGRGGATIVQSGDELGQITFVGADGTNFQSAAAIKSYVDGTPGSGTDMPGRLSFWTSPDNSTTMVERLRITSGGSVNIGGDYTQTSKKFKVTGNATIDGGLVVTGTLEGGSGFSISSGNLTLPAYTYHDGDSDTYYGFSGANQFSVFTGGSARVTVTDATTTVANNLTVTGNLQIDGTTTTVNSATMTVDDKNIVLGSGAANDAAVDGGGITLESGDGNKTWNWVDATDAWTSSEHIALASGKKVYLTDTNTALSQGTSNTLRITTNSGYVDIGPKNTSWCHFHTDRASFYFAQNASFNGNVAPYSDSAHNLGSNTGRWANIYGDTLHGDGANVTNVNATTLDSIDSGSFLRSDANDTMTGVLTINTSSAYGLTLNGSNDGKIVLNGTNPYIRFQEGGTNKAYIQWNSNGYLTLLNQESGEYVKVGSGANGLTYVEGGAEKTVFHSGNLSTFGANQIELTTSTNYPLKINSSAEGKIVLQGSSNPYIRFREGTTDKAYIQWSNAGHLQFVNQESGEYLRVSNGVNGLTFTVDGTSRTVWHSGNKPDPANASNLSSGTVAAARLPKTEGGASIVGNFGQWENHGNYNNANTVPAYWGWNYIGGSANCPNSTSSQWYRNRVSLGNGYGFGSDSGDYWLEMAYPRYNHATAGTLWVRTCENGVEGSWSEVGTKPTNTINTKTIALKAGYTIRRGDHHTGHLEGSYNNIGANQAKTNPIYTIGSNYNPNDAALSNMYGIGYSKGTQASFLTSLPGQANSWGMYVAADGDARVFLDGQSGHINASGYLYCDRVYTDSQTTRYLSDVSGNYGSIQINGGGSGNWQGFSIQGRVVFMHNGATSAGIYDDVNNQWMFHATLGGDATMRCNGTTRVTAHSSGATIDGILQVNGNIRRSNHHTGHLEGSYNNVAANSAKSNPIYTIGSSYNPTDAGLSNMYGIGYSHGDASFTPTGASWGMYVASDGDARIFLDSSNSRVYIGTANQYISRVTGNYGTFQCNAGGSGGWEGWGIDGRAVFMHDGGTGTGIYNDVNNHWLFYAVHGAQATMYYNGSARIVADSSGAAITGRVSASGTSTFDNVIFNYNQQHTQRGFSTTSTSNQNASNAPILAGTPGSLSYAYGYQEASGTSSGTWTSPYPDMVFGYHTGVRIGGHTNYKGTRFYADHPSRTSTKLLSIGEGDNNTRVYYHLLPSANNSSDLGTVNNAWRNIYVNDLHLSNKAKEKEGGNDVDGTWGDWTLQEGEDNIYMINNRTGKKFKMNLTEVS